MKHWWSYFWRVNFLALIVLSPAVLVYPVLPLVEDVGVKAKPIFLYGILILCSLLLRFNTNLNQIFWRDRYSKFTCQKIMNFMILGFLIALLLSAVIFFQDTDKWVEGKFSIGVFTFFIYPLLTPFIVRYYSRGEDIDNIKIIIDN